MILLKRHFHWKCSATFTNTIDIHQIIVTNTMSMATFASSKHRLKMFKFMSVVLFEEHWAQRRCRPTARWLIRARAFGWTKTRVTSDSFPVAGELSLFIDFWDSKFGSSSLTQHACSVSQSCKNRLLSVETQHFWSSTQRIQSSFSKKVFWEIEEISKFQFNMQGQHWHWAALCSEKF